MTGLSDPAAAAAMLSDREPGPVVAPDGARGGVAADARVPPAEECVLRPLLDRRARETPERVFILTQDGDEWSFGRLQARVVRQASAFAQLGVGRDDFVALWLPNGIDFVVSWFALNYLGAVAVPINIAYRGNLLAHVLRDADARLIVAHAQLLPRLNGIERAGLQAAVAIGGPPLEVSGVEVHEAAALDGDGMLPPLTRPIEPWDTQSVIYTSGTTGPSKGVLSSYMHLATMGSSSAFPYLTRDDRFLVYLPLYHVGGTLYVYAMLMRGGSVALIESFKTDEFWNEVDRTQSTACQMLGVVPKFLLKAARSQPPRRHTLKNVLLLPSDDSREIAERFGVDVYTTFNMTETCMPLVGGPNPSPAGTCGRVREGVEVRLVDANDCEVPAGAVGELVVRADAPWALSHGYHKNPAATAAAWRNGWFHTGDALRRDPDGNFFFVDRLKDTIRRRGENISSFEIEVEACAHPAVREAAAVAIPGEFGDDEVLLVAAPAAGQTIDPAALLDFLRPRMAHFMVPRFVRVVSELPKTPTQKVQKAALRAEGRTPDTWDRETDGGVVLRREKLTAASQGGPRA